MGRFHDLEAAGTHWINPTRVVANAFRQHSAILSKPLPNKLRVAVFEAFDDHE